MGRKNLLKGLMDEAPGQTPGKTPGKTDATDPPPSPSPTQHARPRREAKGAIGAVSQSIEALKARSLIDLDPFLIDAGGLTDRLEADDAEDAALLASIRDHGQQVPILVRPHPEEEGRYQIVYGRRRVLALRDLGQPVKAMVRDLTDAALVMAQGQENNARKGLSFIEKANFAAQMRDAGYDRMAICDALVIDKTLVSRMLSIVDRVTYALIVHIGAAPAIGRDRWAIMATGFENPEREPETAVVMVDAQAAGLSSNDRFEAAFAYATGQKLVPPPPVPEALLPRMKENATRRKKIKTQAGAPLAAIRSTQSRVVVTFEREGGRGFEDWLVEHLADIHTDWLNSRGD